MTQERNSEKNCGQITDVPVSWTEEPTDEVVRVAPGASQHNVEQMEAIPVPRIMVKSRRRHSR